jgi:hypothetical protein
VIVHTELDYNTLLDRMNREKYILTPIFRDVYYHRTENALLCANILFLNGESYTLSISHKDAPTFPLIVNENCLSTNSKLFQEHTVDISILGYINGIELPSIKRNTYMVDTYAQFSNMTDVNKIIPLMVWNTVLKEYNHKMLDIYEKHHDTINTKAYKTVYNTAATLRDIENEGIGIDADTFSTHFDKKVARHFKNNLVYSEYNCFTSTNRPSNRFGGINYSALNKSDGTRKFIKSRYENGCIVQIDFEAYHLRLVADYLGIKLPAGESLHTTLAKLYFDTDNITEELYSQSKQKTFEIMYGMSKESYGVELFEKIHNMRQLYKDTDTIELPSGMTVQIPNASASKLFNYYIQSLEVVRTIPKLRKILDVFKNTNNHLILYTYDSVLFDMETFDEILVKNIVELVEEDGSFPVRVYKGSNYDNIQEIRL